MAEIDVFATNDLYSSVGDSVDGLATKTEPSGTTKGDGMRESIASLTDLNFLLNQLTEEVKAYSTTRFRHMTDTGSAAAVRVEAIAHSPNDDLYYLVEGNTDALSAWSGESTERRVITPTGLSPTGVAVNSTTNRVVVVGAHATNLGSYSDDQGVTWTPITDSTANFTQVVRDATNELFIALGPNLIFTSATGADSSWTSQTTALALIIQASVTHNGRTIIVGQQAADVSVEVSTNGTTWAVTTNVITVGGSTVTVIGLSVDLKIKKFVMAVHDNDDSNGRVEYYTSELDDGTEWELAATSRDPATDLFNETFKNPSFVVLEAGIWIQGVSLAGREGGAYDGVAISVDQGDTWQSYSFRFIGGGGVLGPFLVGAVDRVFLCSDDGTTNYILST